MEGKHRFEFLDGLRGIAALTVVVFHFTALYGHEPFFSSAPLAVDFFFCLSGFVIAWSYSQRLKEGMHYLTYIRKRLIRLYPMFLMGLVIGFISYLIKLYYGNTSYTLTQIMESNLFNIFYLPYFVSDTIISVNGVFLTNPPAWSLFFELLASFLFLLIFKLPNKQLIVTTALLAFSFVLAVYFYRDWVGWSTENFTGGFPRVGFSFMVGVLISRYFGDLNRLPVIHPVLVLILLILILVMPFHKSVFYWLFCSLFVMPLFVISGARVQIKSVQNKKLMIFLGSISYPIYCLHNPILNIYKGFTKHSIHFYLEISILLIVTFLLTYLIAKFYDDPVRAWLAKY